MVWWIPRIDIILQAFINTYKIINSSKELNKYRFNIIILYEGTELHKDHTS